MSGEQEESNWTGDWNREELASVRPPSSDLDRRKFLKVTGLGAGLALGSGNVAAASSDPPNAKTRLTWWTEEERQNARRNIEQYDWAKQERDQVVRAADDYLEKYSLDDLWRMVTAQKVPRTAGTRRMREIMGGYGSTGTDRPWKIRTESGYVMPTNDFAAYRESGRDDEGTFDPELADDQYLVNEEYPDKPDDWGVDDGYGWVDENGELGEAGEKLFFVAFYNHWFLWRGEIVEMIETFSRAYLYTGDVKYARAGSVLLDRIADVYPEMHISAYPAPPYYNITGGRDTGKILGALWEDIIAPELLKSYDAYYPGQTDQRLVDFLDRKTETYPGLGDKSSTGMIRKNIEDGYVKQILPAVKNSQMIVSSGAKDPLALSARILDEPDGYTGDALEFLFQPGSEKFVGDDWDDQPDKWFTTGGSVLSDLVRNVDRNGYLPEAGPNYNKLGVSTYVTLANVLEGYDAYEGANLWDYPKLYELAHQNIELVLLDQQTPDIGDDRTTYMNNNLLTGAIEDAFQVYGDTVFAQTLHYLNGYSTAGIRGDIFSEDPSALPSSVEDVVESEGVFDLDSTLLPAYGFTALRDGENYTNVQYGETYSFKNLLKSSSVKTKNYPEAIQLQAYSAGQEWTFEFEVEHDGTFVLDMEALRASTYGIYELHVDGEYVRTIDFYGGSQFTFSVERELSEGTHTISFVNDGKNEKSSNYLMALYYLEVLDEAAQETRERAEGRGNEKRAVWHYYGKNAQGPGTSHAHTDTLELGVMAHRLDLAPDLGYPHDLGTPKARNWTAETISHNTVMVDAQFQEPQLVADTHHFDDSDRVKLFDANSTQAYETTEEYRRTTAMVRVDEQNSYAVDFFDVDGGDDHLFSFHSAKGSTTATGLDLRDQDGGTYAGPDVSFASQSYNEDVGNGFNYLRDVSRDEDPSGGFSVDWDVEDYRDRRDDDADVHLRLTMLNDDLDEAALATGEPPALPENPDELTYLLARRQGTDLQSTFTSVVEPYADQRFVESVEPVEVTSEDADVSDARAVKVELSNGRVDYVARGTVPDVMHEVGDAFKFKGFFAVYSEVDGEPEHAYLQDGKLLIVPGHPGPPLVQAPYPAFTGTVEDFTKEMSRDNSITLELDDHANEFDGTGAEYLYVDNADSKLVGLNSGENGEKYAQSGAYPVESVEGGSGDRVTVDVGARTFVRRFRDPDRLAEGGYHYTIEEGDAVRVPVTRSWSVE